MKKILKAPEIAPNEVRNRERSYIEIEKDHFNEPAGQHYIAERSFFRVSTVIQNFHDT